MKFRILAIALFASTIFAILSPAAPANAASSGEFVSDINGLRASKGLPALSVNSSLSSFAQGWAEKMAAAGSISHNPSLSSAPGSWTTVGENVGVGGSEDSIFNALVASSGHYANMVNSKFNSVGVGVAVGSDGRIYTTHDFAAYPSSSSSKPATSSPAATSAPMSSSGSSHAAQPAAPKTTIAPTTAAPAAPTTTAAPAPVAEATPAPAPAAPQPELPAPSGRIVDGLLQVSQISTQG